MISAQCTCVLCKAMGRVMVSVSEEVSQACRTVR